MIRRFVAFGLVIILLYVGFIVVRLFVGTPEADKKVVTDEPSAEEAGHKVYSFSFSKFATDGDKELEIEGDSADIFARCVALKNVIAKAYADDTLVTITADDGVFDKSNSEVTLNKNVVATTETGARLITDTLDMKTTEKVMETEALARVKKDNINVEGEGAVGDSNLEKVEFKKNVRVVIRDEDDPEQNEIVITCDGPLEFDYNENIAYFYNNVVARDKRGVLKSDKMHVYYDKDRKAVNKIVATGNVTIVNPDGNETYSDSVIYLAQEGRIILGGDTEALYNMSSDGTEYDDFFGGVAGAAADAGS